jgi:hypothetical protein
MLLMRQHCLACLLLRMAGEVGAASRGGAQRTQSSPQAISGALPAPCIQPQRAQTHLRVVYMHTGMRVLQSSAHD